jgi:hypothetical protein
MLRGLRADKRAVKKFWAGHDVFLAAASIIRQVCPPQGIDRHDGDG